MLNVKQTQQRCEMLGLLIAASADRLRAQTTGELTEGDQTYSQLDAEDRGRVDEIVAYALRTPEKVAEAIAAKARLDKMYFDALVAQKFDPAQALAIVSRQGVGFLLG
jgi:hypothetical protein